MGLLTTDVWIDIEGVTIHQCGYGIQIILLSHAVSIWLLSIVTGHLLLISIHLAVLQKGQSQKGLSSQYVDTYWIRPPCSQSAWMRSIPTYISVFFVNDIFPSRLERWSRETQHICPRKSLWFIDGFNHQNACCHLKSWVILQTPLIVG